MHWRTRSPRPTSRVLPPGASRRSSRTLAWRRSLPPVSRKVAPDLDEKVQAFPNRPIVTYLPYLFVDTSYFKVRDGVQYVSKALLLIAGIREDFREILGARIADCEDDLTQEDLFAGLKERGLVKVDLVISDAHKGIQAAVERSCPGSSWQMCQVHFIRAVLRKLPRRATRRWP